MKRFPDGITFRFAPPPRPRPKAGDRRTTKKHGEQVRVQDRAHCGALIVRNGRPTFTWAACDSTGAVK